jgi:septum formation protein
MQEQAPRIILASGSPRRRELLGRLGVPFIVRPTAVDEEQLEADFMGAPEDLALHLAQHKAAAGVAQMSDAERAAGVILLAADTTVLLDGAILGKPRDAVEAWAMLRRLRNRTHMVRTGVVLERPDLRQTAGATVATPVTMRDYSDDEIARYIATGDPFDKAGSYAIQHPDFQPVAHIGGCATNVIGLPLCQTALLLRALGLAIPTPDLFQNGCPWDARCCLA